MRFQISILVLCGLLFSGKNSLLAAETNFPPTIPGTADEPIRYVGKDVADLSFHDGHLPWAVGVQNIQVMRANRTHPDVPGADGVGWTYNHAPMLAFWNGKFYLEYLSAPVGESQPPGQTLLVESADGFQWSRPRVVFPSVKISDEIGMSISHQRMGFYVAPNGKLLVLSFYGRAPGVNDGSGVGRAVREVVADGSLGPIFFIRYERQNGWGETNSFFPFYKVSTNAEFVAACDALLKNKLVTLQWWEEDRQTDGFFVLAGETNGFDAKALSYFHRKDGAVVGLWKKRWASLSSDEGASWSKPVRLATVIYDNAKAWGQRTGDGRFVVADNPAEHWRWPLAVMTGEDGILFDNLLTIHGDIPYPRYGGKFKNLGPQYVRGLTEGEGHAPDGALWLTYSMNKEDIWIARVPLPVRGAVDKPVEDNFDDQPVGAAVRDWNVYSPLWAAVSVVKSPSENGNCLELRDEDRYDYAKAVRAFPATNNATVRFRLRAEQRRGGDLEIEILDARGNRPVRLVLDEQNKLVATDGDKKQTLQRLTAYRWHQIELSANRAAQTFDVAVDGKNILRGAKFAGQSGDLQRLSFRTGPFRDFDAKAADALVKQLKIGDRLDGDVKAPVSVYRVDDVQAR